MQTDIHHSHTNTPPSYARSLTASCSNSGRAEVHTLMWAWAPRGFCVFSSPPSSFSVHSSGCFSRDSFSSSSVLLLPSLLLWFRQSSTVASHSSSSFPLLETVPESLGYPVPPCLSLSLFVSVSVLYERQRSFPFFPSSCFFPSHLVSLCVRPPPASVSLPLSLWASRQPDRACV